MTLSSYLFISEVEKYSTDPGLRNTVGRMVDVTYRFNAGILSFAAQKAKDLTDKEQWVSVSI